MQRREWPAVIGLAVFAMFAMACAVFMVGAGQAQNYAAAGAVIVLAVGQIASILAQWSRASRLDESLGEQGETLRGLSADALAAADRMTLIEHQLAHPPGPPVSEILQEMRALRDTVHGLARDMAKTRAEIPADLPRHEAKPEKPKIPAPPREHLDLLLEPMIELSSGATVHYRARINMVDDHGNEVGHDDLMGKADAGGMRPALDLHLLKQVLPVLRRLRVKHPAMRAMVPLGAATLNTQGDLARLLQVMETESDAASGVVFEFAQSDLARLSAGGIDGLARLGRLGATMALSHVAIAGLDLASLRKLGVRFLDIDAGAFDAGFGVSPSWTEFAQFARAMQFQIIAGGVVTALQATAAARVARYAYGTYFAPPRRVRADAGRSTSSTREQAA